MTPTADPLNDLEFNPEVECDARAGRKDHPPADTVLTLRACPGGCPPARLLMCDADVIRFRASGAKRCGKCGHLAHAQAWIVAAQAITDAVPARDDNAHP